MANVLVTSHPYAIVHKDASNKITSIGLYRTESLYKEVLEQLRQDNDGSWEIIPLENVETLIIGGLD